MFNRWYFFLNSNQVANEVFSAHRKINVKSHLQKCTCYVGRLFATNKWFNANITNWYSLESCYHAI